MGLLNNAADVFRTMAAKITNKKAEDVTDNERQAAKAICYGIIYGMGVRTLSERLSVTEEEARDFRTQFLNTFPKVQVFLEDCIQQCTEKGQIKTLSGRVRLIPNIVADDRRMLSAARRVAVNSTIQGSASDLIKTAMLNIDRTMRTEGFDARLILELHDELIFEVGAKSKRDFAEMVVTCMEEAASKLKEPLAVQMPVNVKVGYNWSEMKAMGPKNASEDE